MSDPKTDDWKGESKIRARITPEERDLTTRSVSARMSHKVRTKNGTNMSRAGGGWAKSINVWHIEGKLGK